MRVEPSIRAATVPGSHSVVAARSPSTPQTASGEASIAMLLRSRTMTPPRIVVSSRYDDRAALN
jgi:hypothetical protein